MSLPANTPAAESIGTVEYDYAVDVSPSPETGSQKRCRKYAIVSIIICIVILVVLVVTILVLQSMRTTACPPGWPGVRGSEIAAAEITVDLFLSGGSVGNVTDRVGCDIRALVTTAALFPNNKSHVTWSRIYSSTTATLISNATGNTQNVTVEHWSAGGMNDDSACSAYAHSRLNCSSDLGDATRTGLGSGVIVRVLVYTVASLDSAIGSLAVAEEFAAGVAAGIVTLFSNVTVLAVATEASGLTADWASGDFCGSNLRPTLLSAPNVTSKLLGDNLSYVGGPTTYFL